MVIKTPEGGKRFRQLRYAKSFIDSRVPMADELDNTTYVKLFIGAVYRNQDMLCTEYGIIINNNHKF